MITKGECYREIRSGSRCLGIESPMSKAKVTLKAIDSKDGVTLGGSSVGGNGAFAPRPQATISIRRGKGTVELPAYSAAVVEH